MARPVMLNDGRPRCQVDGCGGPVALSSRYVRQDGTVISSYRRWCSWHTRHPHSTKNPAFEPLPEDDRCQVPTCMRRARKLTRVANARTRPRKASDRQREWDRIHGSHKLLPGEVRYASTCNRHTAKDLPGYVHVDLTPRPRPTAKVKRPATPGQPPMSRIQAQEEAAIETLAQDMWKDDVWANGAKFAKSLKHYRRQARQMRNAE